MVGNLKDGCFDVSPHLTVSDTHVCSFDRIVTTTVNLINGNFDGLILLQVVSKLVVVIENYNTNGYRDDEGSKREYKHYVIDITIKESPIVKESIVVTQRELMIKSV